MLNAIYSQTGKSGVLYQVKNMLSEEFGDLQRERFLERDTLFTPYMQMLQGKELHGIVVGGNIRCFLKLAGTKYFPDMQDKILFLEAMGGEVPQILTYLSQLKSCGVFQKVRGILLGTFCAMEEENAIPDVETLVRMFIGKDMPLAVTKEIGHRPDSKAIWIGKTI